MGDRYLPTRPRGNERARYDPYARDHDYDPYARYDRDERANRHDAYNGRGTYRPPPPRSPPRYGRDGYGGQDEAYTFRGAATRQDDRAPPDHFSFRLPGPRFPSPDRYAPPPPPRAPRRPRRGDMARRGDHRRAPHVQPNGRPPWRPQPPSSRKILHETGRAKTPEQLEGMNRDGQVRFNALASSGDESEGEHAGRPTSPSEEEGEIRRKRFKVDAPPAPNPDMPKWSNPDPYSALPPTEHSGAPKKDIVQVIRKAKNNDAPRHDMTQAVAKNADFISFNFDDDFGDDHASTGQVNVMDDNSSEASSFTSKMSETAAQNFKQAANGEAMPSFGMKRPNRADASIGGRPPPIDLTSDDDDPRPRKRPHFSEPVDLTGDMGAPPAPPPGFVMPTDEELVQQYLGGQPKGRKRKHDEQSRGKGDVTDAWQANWTNSTPWRTVDRSQTADVGVRLHEEISDFFNFVRPHQYEEDIRNDLIDRVQAAVRSFGGDSKNVDIRCFGSFAAGIYLPTADMDLVALSRSFMHHGQKSFCQTGSKLYKLLQHLIRAGIAQAHTTSAVPRAKVPIVKFTDRKTGIKVDISFENDSGLLANSTFKEWKTQYPAMPVVVVLIKQMLAMRDLNEVFTGGLGGFSIICLVVSMMQRMSDDQYYKTSQNPDYGSLLLKFLDDYGNKFDMRSTGIVMDPPGLYDKIRNPKSFQNASNLTIIDPNNPNNDISGGSREVHAVFEVFRKAHAHIVQLMAKVHAGKDAGDSFLGCVIGGNYSSFIRQRNKLYKLHGGDNGSPSPEPIVNDQPTPQKRKRGPTRNHDPPSKNVRTNSGQIAATSGGPLAGRVSGGPQNKKGTSSNQLSSKETERRNAERARSLRNQNPQLSSIIPQQLSKPAYKAFKSQHHLS